MKSKCRMSEIPMDLSIRMTDARLVRWISGIVKGDSSFYADHATPSAHLERVLRVHAETVPVACATRAALALTRCCLRLIAFLHRHLRDGRDDERVHARARVEGVLLAHAAVDHVADVVDRQRRLRHVRRQHHLAHVRRRGLEALGVRGHKLDPVPIVALDAAARSTAGAPATP